MNPFEQNIKIQPTNSSRHTTGGGLEFKDCPKIKSSSSLARYGLKTVALFLVLMIIITLCGCSKEDRGGTTGSFEKIIKGGRRV